MRLESEIPTDSHARGEDEESQTDRDEPPAAEPLGSTGLFLLKIGLCVGLHRRVGFARDVLGVQPAGASISFHPFSPGSLELVTEYVTPSGPTT